VRIGVVGLGDLANRTEASHGAQVRAIHSSPAAGLA